MNILEVVLLLIIGFFLHDLIAHEKRKNRRRREALEAIEKSLNKHSDEYDTCDERIFPDTYSRRRDDN